MRKSLLALAAMLTLLATSCQTVPITGRQQLALVPLSTILSMSFDSYRKFLSEHTVVKGTADAWMVQDVGVRIQNAVERYFAQQNMPDQLRGYAWEFTLIEGKDVNAWCMPGGKVIVYTGSLPVTQGEAGLAVMLGHEIAHAVSRHGDERMSQGLATQFGGAGLAAALRDKPEKTRSLFLSAFGAGSTNGVPLPYSRLHESEADRLGLIFMAMAGYDPRTAVDFWKRMEAGKKGKVVPEFLSTHPSDRDRINNIERLLPEALQYYRAS
jgi:predicted Zn-dependent protease